MFAERLPRQAGMPTMQPINCQTLTKVVTRTNKHLTHFKQARDPGLVRLYRVGPGEEPGEPTHIHS
jgi:hypothetical protein